MDNPQLTMESGFTGNGDELVRQVADSMEGFAWCSRASKRSWSIASG